MRFFSDFVQYVKPSILPILIVSALIFLDWHIMTPHIKQKYLFIDTVNFEYDYWKYFFISAGIMYATFLIGLLFVKNKKSLIASGFLAIFPAIFSAFILDSFVEKTVLCANTYYTSEIIQKEYKIESDNTQKKLHAINGEYVIFNKREISIIDDIRKEKNLPSIYDLKNGDTILVEFHKGYLDTKYFKQ